MVSSEAPPPAGQAPGGAACPHPWLRVTCGTCGAPVDTLGRGALAQAAGDGEPGGEPGAPGPGPGDHALFIVARGHPELVEQLRALMGHRGDVQVIEDRRQESRATAPSEDAVAARRAELRRRLAGDGSPGPA